MARKTLQERLETARAEGFAQGMNAEKMRVGQAESRADRVRRFEDVLAQIASLAHANAQLAAQAANVLKMLSEVR